MPLQKQLFFVLSLWTAFLRGKNQSFYGWPETVAQWVEVLLGAWLIRVIGKGSGSKLRRHV